VVRLGPVLLAGLRAYPPPENGIDLASPFTRGNRVVVQGGDDVSINHHASVAAQRHAPDIGAVDAWNFSRTPTGPPLGSAGASRRQPRRARP